ncbi:RICIN domain-containing protein [Streptomyces sp. NPDC059009]|uniref:RICIN domain-containing protein n=1 Tax=Streptomyces sp. NPDC059009 TaxID=3346694 RepID=UPI0036986A07
MAMQLVVEPGRYFIKSAAYADRVLDVSGGSTAPNTPVIGWHWQKSDNQAWELVETQFPNEFIIKSAIGEVFLNLSSDRSYPPKLAVQPVYVVWPIVPVASSAFRISYPGTLQVVTLATETEGSQGILQDGTLSPTQEWTFERA